MSNRLVIADSSVWVGHLTGHGGAPVVALAELLQRHRVAVNDMVRLEVLTGARDDTQYAELADALQGLHLLPVTGAVWGRAERLRYEVRRKGHLIPTPDAVIAASALMYDCEVLHADRHFDIIARSAPLRIYR